MNILRDNAENGLLLGIPKDELPEVIARRLIDSSHLEGTFQATISAGETGVDPKVVIKELTRIYDEEASMGQASFTLAPTADREYIPTGWPEGAHPIEGIVITVCSK